MGHVMLRHHFNARRKRLENLVSKAEIRVAELAESQDDTPQGKRVRTMAARSLKRHRQSLDNLLKLHGAAFGFAPSGEEPNKS